MSDAVLTCLLADLSAYTVGLVDLHIEYRCWLECYGGTESVMERFTIGDILERTERAIRQLEKEIRG